jgi:hypothetical protein
MKYNKIKYYLPIICHAFLRPNLARNPGKNEWSLRSPTNGVEIASTTCFSS